MSEREQMMAYIDREKALSHPFANGKYDHEHANEHFIFGFEDYKEWLEQLPTADVVERRHGEWVHDGGKWKNRYYCSKCFYKLFDEPTNFCPNCGADMRKETENG